VRFKEKEHEMIVPKKAYAVAILWIALSLLRCVGIAQSLQYHVVSANEWLYPDSTIPVPPLHATDLHAARGGRVGFQMLLRGLKAGAPLVSSFNGDLKPEVFQLIDVNVPENSGPPCSAIPPNQPTPKYVIRKAPYRVYEALRPLRDGDPVRADSDALYVSEFRLMRRRENTQVCCRSGLAAKRPKSR
jgi:hypothetical protein